MSAEQKMEFLYEWCAQISMVVQELRSLTQTLMDKEVEVEAMIASVKRRVDLRSIESAFHALETGHVDRPSSAVLADTACRKPGVRKRSHSVRGTYWCLRHHALRPALRFDKSGLRIPRKYGYFVFGVVQAGLTSAIAAGVANIPSFGTFAFVKNWLGSWLIAWMTTIPIVLVAAPRIRRLVLGLTIGSGGRGKGI